MVPKTENSLGPWRETSKQSESPEDPPESQRLWMIPLPSAIAAATTPYQLA